MEGETLRKHLEHIPPNSGEPKKPHLLVHDRQTDTQTDRHTDRQTDRQTHTDTQKDRQDKQDRHTDLLVHFRGGATLITGFRSTTVDAVGVCSASV